MRLVRSVSDLAFLWLILSWISISLCNKKFLKPGTYHFLETFEDPDSFKSRWIESTAAKSTDPSITYDGKFELTKISSDISTNNFVLHVPMAGKHYAIATPLANTFVFDSDPLIVQYEFKLPPNMHCGGAYMKLLSHDSLNHDLKNFHDNSPYSIMFGPDKCGSTNKMHFIFRHKNILTGEYEEKHLSTLDDKSFVHIFTDGEFHQIQLILEPSNDYKLLLDKSVISSGSLLTSFTPPVNPEKEIDDPDDVQPDDWDDREKILDPNVVKPVDWDDDAPPMIPDPKAKMPSTWLEHEPKHIDDPDATKPDDWNDEQDGDWQAPLIPNPKCQNDQCGKWSPPLIKNPQYKGKWSPPLINNPAYKGKYIKRVIPNPKYFFDPHPFKMASISAVGFELWTVDPDIYFDNILVTSRTETCTAFSAVTFDVNLSRRRLNYVKNVIKSPIFIISTGVITCVSIVVAFFFYRAKFVTVETSDIKKELIDTELQDSITETNGVKHEESDEDPIGENIRKRRKTSSVRD